MASRHCDRVLPVGVCLSSGFSHETKVTNSGPLDTALILDLQTWKGQCPGGLEPLIVEPGGILKMEVLFAFQTMT